MLFKASQKMSNYVVARCVCLQRGATGYFVRGVCPFCLSTWLQVHQRCASSQWSQVQSTASEREPKRLWLGPRRNEGTSGGRSCWHSSSTSLTQIPHLLPPLMQPTAVQRTIPAHGKERPVQVICLTSICWEQIANECGFNDI